MSGGDETSATGQPGPEARRLLVPPVPGLSHPGARLFLLSAAVLFLELLLIRWIPANVTYIGFFSNFLLMGCFLGIGTGIILGRRGRARPVRLFGPLLLAVVVLVAKAQLDVQVRTRDELFFGLAESHAADVNFLVLPTVVALVTVVLASLALPLGPLLRAMPPLRAYALDLLGSLAGIATFTALAALGTPPVVWFSVLAGLVALLGLGEGLDAFSLVSAATLAGAIALSPAPSNQRPGMQDVWSPYYRLTTYPVEGYTAINANGIPHQSMLPVDVTMKPEMISPYDQIYRWFPGRTFDRVLIVGAGSGSDTAIALRRGVRHLDCVEIDPMIARLGREHHPNRPYDDPRVTLHVNDGRNFVKNAKGPYDLVIFALPDSLTLASSMANLRLESFIFTREAFEDVKAKLGPDGIFCLYNFYRQPWLLQKIAGMLEATFHSPPLVRLAGENVLAVLADGPGIAALPGGKPPGDVAQGVRLDPSLRPATDDWPFLYLREPGVPQHYRRALAVILAFAVVLVAFAGRASGTSARRASPHFFVLGVAFMLLETRSLVTFSLLFGTTWLVNALTFFAILTSVLLAIGVNALVRFRRPWLLYAALLGSLALGWLVPPESLLVDPAWLRYAIAATLAFLPVFLANLVFTHSFRDTSTADTAFASNLLGAMLGGALEYASLVTGYRALLLIAAALYALAGLLAGPLRVLGDRELVASSRES